jgi:hypothetical protein
VGTDAVAEIAAAARTTRAAGSARVHARVFTDPPQPPDRDVSSALDGMTDLERRRTRIVQREIGGWWTALAQRIVGRWPWLEDVVDDGGDDDEPLTIGTTELSDFGLEVDIEPPATWSMTRIGRRSRSSSTRSRGSCGG